MLFWLWFGWPLHLPACCMSRQEAHIDLQFCRAQGLQGVTPSRSDSGCPSATLS
jgi:hypothetical protein